MNRRPWWPIPVGLAVWGIAIYVAVVGPWWPLAIVAAVSLIPGAIVGGVLLLTRGARRDAQALAEQHAHNERARPADAEPVAEPPTVHASKTRTNAKTAGRRRGGPAALVAMVVLAGAGQGCDKIERARAERRARESADTPEVKDVAAPPSSPGSTPATTGTPPGNDATHSNDTAANDAAARALAAALAHAITPPDGLEATWRVDPFVAALLVEQIKLGVGPGFTQLQAPIPQGPSAGFRVGEVPDGSLLHRLGLRTGDVIETIGGVVLHDASRLGFALDGAENRIDVMVFRDDVSTVHSYRLNQGLAWRSLLAAFPPGSAAVADPHNAATAQAGGDAAPQGDTAGGSKPATVGGGGSGGGGSGGSGSGGSGSGGGGSGSSGSGGGGSSSGSGSGSGSGGSGSGGSGSGGSGGGSAPAASDPVRCESASKCTVTKAYFNKMVASPSALSAQANIVPAIANDVHSGYKLKSVKAGSAVAKLGFRAGDKITHVNGVDLTDDLAAFGLLADLSGTSLFRIRYERGGAATSKTVVVE